MKVYKNLSQIITLIDAHRKDGRNLTPMDLSIIQNGSVVFDENIIKWVGPTKNLPLEYHHEKSIDLSGHVLTPEIVDSHTHLVFGGDRASEYTDRLNGTSYEEIAKRGGGILFTMNQTNLAPIEELYNTAKSRIERIHSFGVGTIEIKSGYALNFDREYEISLLIDRLKKEFAPKIQIFNTFMAAHDIPKNFSSSKEYLSTVVLPLLDKLAPLKIIDAVDIFHEKNYFTEEDVNLLFNRAHALGIQCKTHSDELNDNSGAELATKHHCLSADHLLKISDNGIKAMAQNKTVATLLPGTAFFLGKPLAPARKMLDAGVKVSIASDYNPGSCHCDNLLLIASISAAQLKINQAEMWAAMTLNAAHALGLNNQGVIKEGFRARFGLFNTDSLSQISYNWGKNFAVNLP